MNLIKDIEIFAKKYYDKLEVYNHNKDYWENHILRGKRFAIDLGIKEGANLFVIEIAFLLHDIGKVYGKENHAENSYKLAQRFLSTFDIDPYELNLILKCIKKHSSKYSQENNEIEVKIIQSADALAILFDNGWENFISKSSNKEEINKIIEKSYQKINIGSAQILAQPRVEYLKNLLEQQII